MNEPEEQQDAIRLQSLRDYGIINSGFEQEFEDVAKIAALVCRAPFSFVTFVEAHRQWHKAAVGTGLTEAPIEQSICRYAIRGNDVFIIPDTAKDDRTKHMPLVCGQPHVRFYAGAPIFSAGGVALGTVSVLDTKPRELDQDQIATLEALARQVSSHLERRRIEARQRADSEQIRTDAEFLRGVLSSSADCIKVLDLDGSITFMSEGGMRVMEVDDFNVIRGCNWPNLWRQQGHVEAVKALDRARAGGVGRFQGAAPTFKGTPRWWDVQVTPMMGPDDRPERLLAISRDITDIKEVKDKLEVADLRFSIAMNASGMIGVWEWDIEKNIIFGDANFARLYGLDADRLAEGMSPDEVGQNLYPNEDPITPPTIDLDASSADVSNRERRIRLPDGTVKWVHATGRLIRDENGIPRRWPGLSIDITQRKESDERLRFVMRELTHRVKNTLAVVQAISMQTLRSATSVSEAATVLAKRIAALAQAYDTLLEGNWTSTNLPALVEHAVIIHGGDVAGRFAIEGPDVVFGPPTALSFALVIHELGTNAIKYGALSVPQGQVRIHWSLDERDGEKQLRFHWLEVGGPPVRAPKAKGFGTKLIERSLASNSGATVQLSYLPTGVSFVWEARLSDLQHP